MIKSKCISGALVAALLCLTGSAAIAATGSPAELTGALQWRSVGPYTGGRVTAVAGVAGEPNLFYAGYAGGGVWETEDYGQHWEPLTDKYFKPETSGSVGYLAVAPSNPKVIYVGTGDSGPRNTVLTGHGMYKSTDGGKSWSYIGLGDTHMISWVTVDPDNADVVYVAALGHLFGPNSERGVYKTTDGGKTWNKILYVNDQTGAAMLAMDPKDPQVLYASMWQVYRTHWTLSSGGPGSGIYKTTDGGAHWTNITHNAGLPTGIFGKAGIAVAPSDPNVIYALIQAEYKGQAGGLFRSQDAGKTWKLINNSMDITQRAFYYSRIYVDPKDANTVYFLNAPMFVSHDGGKTLTGLHPPHGDNHAMWINPDNPQIFIEGNDGGATVTLNGGKSWSSEDNQPTGQFYNLHVDDQFPFRMYASQQDRSPVVGPSAVAGGVIPPVWTTLPGVEESWVVPQPGSPWIVYTSDAHAGGEGKHNLRTGETFDVSPWPANKFGVAGTEADYRYGWIHRAVAFAPGDPDMLLVGANVLFESNDQGVSWKAISPDLTRNDKSKQQRPGGPISADVTGEEMFDTISAIGVSPLNNNTIWVGSDDGLVYVTTDGGQHWNEVHPSELPIWSTITSIEPSHTAAGTAYVAASRFDWDDFHPYVYKTTDYGKHWTSITAGLPDNQYVEAIRQDPNDPGLLFAGTSATVYFSVDNGAHWKPLSLNLPAVRVNGIAIQPQQHAIAISTFGRAFWVLDNLQFLEQLSTAKVPGNAAYLFKPQQAWLVKRSGGGFGGARIGGENLASGVTVFYHLPESYDGKAPVKLSFTTMDGKLIRSFTLSKKPEKSDASAGATTKKSEKLHPGMNRFQWDLSYPGAVDVKGLYTKAIAMRMPGGPEVVPGTYQAVLSYAGATQKQAFTVTLDPRLGATQADLQQRFDLLIKIQDTLSRLNAQVNTAIDARNKLAKAVGNKRVSGKAAHQALDDLNRDINNVVDFKIKSSEGSLVYPPRLRSWLASIESKVQTNFVAPTPAMVKVADGYMGQAGIAIARLQSDVSQANAVLRR